MFLLSVYWKVYVGVELKVNSEGEVRPLSITFENGNKYKIDRFCRITRAHSTVVDGTGIRYIVVISNHQTYLFEDEGKWFVEVKNPT